MLRHTLEFITQAIQRFHTTGAVLPSSRFLAHAMTRAMRQAQRAPLQILEVGPGTGVFTDAMIRLMRGHDTLDCYELNPHFGSSLRRRLAREPRWQARAKQVKIFTEDISLLPADKEYDFIVCGLPFNNFNPGLVKKIMRALFRAVKPGGTLIYFEYLFLRRLRSWLPNRAERLRMLAIERIMRHFCRQGDHSQDVVFINLPPALIRRIHKSKI